MEAKPSWQNGARVRLVEPKSGPILTRHQEHRKVQVLLVQVALL